MPKFRYYIASIFDGSVTGTNDRDTALHYAQSEDDFVIDTEANEWLHNWDFAEDEVTGKDIQERKLPSPDSEETKDD